MSFLALSQVRKSFGALTVVNDVSLEVARGEFFALAGFGFRLRQDHHAADDRGL